MPNFSHPFNGNNCEKTLSEEELIRAIRFSIAGEYEAIQLYEQLAQSTNNKLSKKVLFDIAEEEQEHVGELLKVLEYLSPKEIENYAKGKTEVEEKFF